MGCLSITAKKAEELDRIIADEGLNADETKAFVENAFRDGAIPVTGTAITKILPPVSKVQQKQQPCGEEANGAGQAGRILRTLLRLILRA